MRVATVETEAPTEVRSFPSTTLVAMAAGSMVDAGGFPLPRNFAVATGVFGALIAWVIATILIEGAHE
jgi:arginine:ornithine antiporter/lysine permease